MVKKIMVTLFILMACSVALVLSNGLVVILKALYLLHKYTT